MATVYGVNTTSIQSAGLANKIAQGQIDGRVKVFHDTYVLAGTEASGTVLIFALQSTGSGVNGLIPAGAKILGIQLAVTAAQTALTMSIGDGNSATRYGSAVTSLQTAGTYLFGGKDYTAGTIALDQYLKLTTGGATATAATLLVDIFYSVD